jgi:hypothetical protein
MNNFGSYTVSSYLPPNAPLLVVTGVNWEYIRINNNSTYELQVNFTGIGSFIMSEFYLEDFPIPYGFTGQVIITPIQNVSSIGHSVSNLVVVTAWSKGELSNPQSQPLAQPAVTTTATGKPIFSATFGIGTSVGSDQFLNVFNPVASGVVMIVHSAEAFSSETGNQGLAYYLIYNSGADLNLATSVPAVSHSGTLVPPISVAHCTGVDQNPGIPAASIIETQQAQSGVTVDLVKFPDEYRLYPGGNLSIGVISSTGGHAVRCTLKWTEDTVTPIIPVPGGVNVASSIKNDGNPVSTQVIEVTPLGQASSSLLVTNDGLWNAKVIQSGIYHELIQSFSSGNPLRLGQAADITEILGILAVDGNIQPNNTFQSQFAGSVSGTVTLYTPVWGNSLKIGVVVFVSYQDATGARNMIFPSAMNALFCYSGSISTTTFTFNNGGVANGCRHMLTLGGAGAAGTDEAITTVKALNFVQVAGTTDRIVMGATPAAAVNSITMFIGQ